jgi:thiamine biosynthesis lipoprotein
MSYTLSEHRFRAMNTEVAAWLWSDIGHAAVWLREVEAFFGEVEAELSRFRPDSGLSRLNAAVGRGPQPISELLETVLSLALKAAEESNGLFDPTVLHALRQAGYDRSFELLAGLPAQDAGQPVSPGGGATVNWRAVELNPILGTAALPPGLGLDLGGIAKGWAVDRAAEMLGAWGAAMVDAGGDIRVSAAAGGEPWPIGIQNPFDPARDLGVIALDGGAVVTSTVGRRRWQRDQQTMHHLIDPRTGKPSQSDLHTVTVLAPTAANAEVAAKVALILGSDRGRAHLIQRGLSGVFVDQLGRLEVVGSPIFSEPVIEGVETWIIDQILN